jgi:heme/copper-type cytochrome/quinol oxidase subunit 1
MNPMGDKEPRPSRAGRLARVAAPLLALALLVAGIVLLSLPVRQESVGWFAYAPLSQQTFAAQSLLIMDAEKWAGVALTGAGLLTLAFWTGYRTGRQSRRRGDGQPGDHPPADG